VHVKASNTHGRLNKASVLLFSWLSRELLCLAGYGRLEADKASWSSPRKWRCRLALLRASHLSSDTQRAVCHYIVWLLSRNPFLVLGRNKEPVRFPVVPVCMSDVLTLTPTKVNCAGKCENVEYVFICLKSVCSCIHRYSTLQESLLLCSQGTKDASGCVLIMPVFDCAIY